MKSVWLILVLSIGTGFLLSPYSVKNSVAAVIGVFIAVAYLLGFFDGRDTRR